MTLEETYKILNDMRLVYSGRFNSYTEDDIVRLTQIWHSSFKGVPHNIMEEALKKALRSTKFMPTIYDITEILKSFVYDKIDTKFSRYDKFESYVINAPNRHTSYIDYYDNHMNDIERKFITGDAYKRWSQRIKYGNEFGIREAKDEFFKSYDIASNEVEMERSEMVGKNDMLYLELNEERKMIEKYNK